MRKSGAVEIFDRERRARMVQNDVDHPFNVVVVNSHSVFLVVLAALRRLVTVAGDAELLSVEASIFRKGVVPRGAQLVGAGIADIPPRSSAANDHVFG
jgi:hypothetical protein